MKRRKKRQRRQEQQGEDGEALLQRGRGRRSGEVDSGGNSAGRGGDDSSRSDLECENGDRSGSDPRSEFELREGEELSLEGIATIAVAQGCLAVQGYLITPERGGVTVCGNASVGWPLRCRPVFHGRYSTKGPERPERCVVRLEDASVDGVSGLAYDAGDQASTSSSGISRSRTYQHDVSPAPDAEAAPGGWSTCLEAVVEDLCDSRSSSAPLSEITALVCGPRNAGKSSFCRQLVNSLLNSNPVVAYLEGDCGQPEFTPPGSVSLVFVDSVVVGPPFMHPRRPVRACFVGDTTPKTDPALYLSSVEDLVGWYSNEGRAALARHLASTGRRGGEELAPLVINTPGWVKGLGFEVLDRLVRRVRPKHLVQLTTGTARDLPSPAESGWEELGLAVRLPPAHSHGPPSGVSAADTRSLMWLSFCHQCSGTALDLRGTLAQLHSKAAAGLCRTPPFRASLGSLTVMSPSPLEFPSSLLPAVLNASLVGLARKEDIGGGACYPFLGFGIVRSVDVGSGDVFLLTNVGEEELQEVGVLVLGSVRLPQQLLQNETFQAPYVARGAVTAEGVGAGAIKGRNNMRRGRLEG